MIQMKLVLKNLDLIKLVSNYNQIISILLAL